jgi:hypothetical protein
MALPFLTSALVGGVQLHAQTYELNNIINDIIYPIVVRIIKFSYPVSRTGS